MPGRMFRWSLALAVCLLATAAHADTRIVARCGQGFLEDVDGYRVLHVKGAPYEMGYQQGVLLKDDIRESVRFLFDVKAKELKIKLGGMTFQPSAKAIIGAIAQGQKRYIPPRFLEELRGVADGAGMTVEEITAANFIPELFHCSGFALSGSATKGGTLYHGRILDYGCDWRLQDHAVLTVAEPEGKIPFVNVTYAGFVGSVTGMNARHISIGEMGGAGMGHWAGIPMAFLVRMALEEAGDLDEAIAAFRDNPRTCEYYYVVADGNSGKAVGMEAHWDRFGVVRMGDSHPRLPHALPDTVLLSAGDRYEELARRAKAGHGTFDSTSARELMRRPVAMKSNLHSVLFAPGAGRLWVANASKDGQPASEQPYREFSLDELRAHQAGPVKVDLRTKAGVEAVKGQWRYHDVTIKEVEGKGPPPENKVIKAYSFEPRAEKPDFDDSAWEVLDPTTLGQRRAAGQLCFNWYRIKVTVPPEAEGKAVHFVTTVDDYGEVWVDGKLDYKPGATGGSVVAGFNAPNRVELKDAKPGRVYQVAVFGINGPISATPGNWIFLGDTYLEIGDKK